MKNPKSMDTFNEKKWFVYVSDHHEGPYSLADLQSKVRDGALSGASYLWMDGMADWKVLSEVPEAASLLNPPRPPAMTPPRPPVMYAEAPTTEAPAPVELEPSFSGALSGSTLEEESPIFSGQPTLEVKEDSFLIERPTAASMTSVGVSSSEASLATEETPVFRPKRKNRVLRYVFVALIPLAFATLYLQGTLDSWVDQPAVRVFNQSLARAVEPTLISLAEKFPVLSTIISPIPRLSDVTPEEFEELRRAASAPIAKEGPKISLAVSSSDMLAPEFYVGGNLPDGAVIEVRAIGQSDTLLGTLSVNAGGRITFSHKYGKTGPLRNSDGKSLPRGIYEVFAFEADGSQPSEAAAALMTATGTPGVQNLPAGIPAGRKLLVRKEYFLGGPQDETYNVRLKEYHDKLRAMATVELADAKNLLAEIETRFGETIGTHEKLRAHRSKKSQQKAWSEFHTRWTQANDSILARLSKAPEQVVLENFYSSLYLTEQGAEQAVTRVHGLHHAFFTGSVDSKAFGAQLDEQIHVARGALNAFRIKIEEIEKLPSSPAGVPGRDI